MNDYLRAILLGIVEGITEFLPISSTGHMLLVEQTLDLELESPFWKLFTIAIQLGAILAVVAYYRARLRELIVDFLHTKMPRWRHPLVLVVLAVIPAGLVGVTLKKQIDQMMEHALPIGIALIVGGLLIEWIERWSRGRGTVDDVSRVSPLQALGIGVAQVWSLMPGVSRSASTIMGGLICGLQRQAAADFAFLLGIPTMIAATGYSLLKHPVALEANELQILAVGFVTAFITAYLVVAWFLHYIRTHSFRLFVVYRIFLGLAVVAASWRGWLH
jgi:undecaprenyl-diphosphatase